MPIPASWITLETLHISQKLCHTGNNAHASYIILKTQLKVTSWLVLLKHLYKAMQS
jgi:hypothetical protein